MVNDNLQWSDNDLIKSCTCIYKMFDKLFTAKHIVDNTVSLVIVLSKYPLYIPKSSTIQNSQSALNT